MTDQGRSQPNAGEIRSQMMRGGPGRPGKIEKARDPRRALARLLPYLKPFRAALIVVLVLILASTALGLVGPYLMGQAIDKFIAAKRVDGLETIAFWMLVVFVLGNASDAASGWMMAGVSQKALKGVRRQLF
jgi:ATP-binding cassette subfamily B multidrug efflux pump